jgi:hypothetical protein
VAVRPRAVARGRTQKRARSRTRCVRRGRPSASGCRTSGSFADEGRAPCVFAQVGLTALKTARPRRESRGHGAPGIARSDPLLPTAREVLSPGFPSVGPAAPLASFRGADAIRGGSPHRQTRGGPGGSAGSNRGAPRRGRLVRRPQHRAHRQARGDLAHRVLLLLPRQARAAHAPDRRRRRAAVPAGRDLVLGRRRPRGRVPRGADQHRRALRRARRAPARDRRGLDLRRRGRRGLARAAGALRRRRPPAHRGRAGRGPRRRAARPRDSVRAVLDDRAHDVPALGRGPAVRDRRHGRGARRDLAAVGLRRVPGAAVTRGSRRTPRSRGAPARTRPSPAAARRPRRSRRRSRRCAADGSCPGA